jgi:DNA-binding NtrC family response regulator
MTKINSLFAFVDPKDPFSASEIAGEQLPGPILSIMSAKPFGHLFLFHTPHTRENAAATEKEVFNRYPECQIVVHELPVSDPKDYSSVMGSLARTVRLMRPGSSEIAVRYVCVSSGTAEMRAAWFLLAALGVLPARMLQVGSPARPLFGEANVREVRMDSSDWRTIRDLAMPEEYFHRFGDWVGQPEAKAVAGGTRGLLWWLRRERKKPDASPVPEEPKAGEETFGFDRAFVERIRMLYGDPLTEVLLPLLSRKFMYRKLSPDNVQALTDKTFRKLAYILRYETRPSHYPRKTRRPKHFAAFVNSICDGVLLEYAKNLPPGEYAAPDFWGPTAEQLDAIRRQMQGLDQAAELAQSEPGEETQQIVLDGDRKLETPESQDGAAELALSDPGREIKELLRSSRRLEGRELEEMLAHGRALFGEARRLIPGLDDALLELEIFIGSAALRHAAEQAGIAAGSHLPVLLLGETGTGKERFAQLIHRLSPRCDRGLVSVNCAAIPAALAETYLFGHIKGIFTGAISDRKGIFEAADLGTLFLDEVAELTLEVQAKLLRVIQDGEVQRLGNATSQKVDVRIIAASNRDLRKEVSAGRFREDLYFRLAVVQIKLPALRERRSEIPELALTLLRKINLRRTRPHKLTTAALARLEGQCWPGNVRELLNVLERSVLYSHSDVIDAEDLIISSDPPAKDLFATLPEPSNGFKVDEYLTDLRDQLFARALAKCKFNQTEAAKLLGVSKQAVSKWVQGKMTTSIDGARQPPLS